LAGLSIKLANDLKEAMERLNQNSTNSSKPSGSLAPWDKGSDSDDEAPAGVNSQFKIQSGVLGSNTMKDYQLQS